MVMLIYVCVDLWVLLMYCNGEERERERLQRSKVCLLLAIVMDALRADPGNCPCQQ